MDFEQTKNQRQSRIGKDAIPPQQAAEVLAAGEESVWDYPRPPRIERWEKSIFIKHHGIVLVDAPKAWRVLETSHPPSYYIASDYVHTEYLRANRKRTFCEWKGIATYFDIELPDETIESAAWTYAKPTDRFGMITGYFSFYAHPFDEVKVDGEQVHSQEGSFYGGWINSWIKGPFKGAPGTGTW